MDEQELKFLAEIRRTLSVDILWKLNKVYYSLPYPRPDAFTTTDEVGFLITAVEKLCKFIEDHVAQRVLEG